MRYLSTLALISLAACVDEAHRPLPFEAPSLSIHDEPAAAGDTGTTPYLAGLSEQDVVDMSERYSLDLADLQVRLAAPFHCDAFGDLCAVMSPQNGENIILDVIDRMAAGQELSEIQFAIEAQAGPAQAAWEQEQLALGVPFYGSPSLYTYKSYTNLASQACKIRVQSTITNWIVNVEHQAKLNNSCWSTFGFYTPSIVGTAKVCMNSKRVGGGSTSTTNLCTTASNWDYVGRSNWMGSGGTHTAKATGTASGSTISGSVSTSVTATWW